MATVTFREFDGYRERAVLIGLATSPAVLGRLAPLWSGDLFADDWANTVADWCFAFYKKHGRAPGAQLEYLFKAWAAQPRDEAAVRLVERFLTACGDQMDAEGGVNVDHVLDIAGDYFEEVRLGRMADVVKGHLAAGRVADARREADASRRLEIGRGGYVDVFQDRAAFASAFSRETREPLLEYPGPLGEFLQGQFRRDALVAILATEKAGKCVSEDSEVLLDDGRLCRIGDLVRRGEPVNVVAYDETSMRFVVRPVAQFWDNGPKQCFELTTRTGRRIVTTANHQYLTHDGWRLLEDISPGDHVAVPKRLRFFGDQRMDDAELKFLAYMLAEGGCTADQLTFTNADPVLVDDFAHCCDQLDIGHRRKGISTHLLRAGWLRKKYPAALWKVTSKQKVIPEAIFRCPEDQIAVFLRVFFSCDGYALNRHNHKRNPSVGITLANERMLRQIGHLLIRLGVVHQIKYDPASCLGKRFPAWTLSIRDRVNVNLFLEKVNFLSGKYLAPDYSVRPRSFLDKLPNQVACRLVDDMTKECRNLGHSFHQAFTNSRGAQGLLYQVRRGYPIMRCSFEPASALSSVRRHLDSDALWDEVVSIRPVGLKQTYDLGVEDIHNFVADDCIVHNSFWQLDIAYRAMLNRKRVAFFSLGDMPQNEVFLRLAARNSHRPYVSNRGWPLVVPYPVDLVGPVAGSGLPAEVTYEHRTFDGPLDEHDGWRDVERTMREEVRSANSYFRLECHPAGAVTVQDIQVRLQQWEYDGWCADMVVIDYADLLRRPGGRMESWDSDDKVWEALSALRLDRHVCVVTATQANREAYERSLMGRANVGGAKRKHAHVTAMLAVNQTDEEKELGLCRLNWLDLREGAYSQSRVVHVAGCLALAEPAVLSAFSRPRGPVSDDEPDAPRPRRRRRAAS